MHQQIQQGKTLVSWPLLVQFLQCNSLSDKSEKMREKKETPGIILFNFQRIYFLCKLWWKITITATTKNPYQTCNIFKMLFCSPLVTGLNINLNKRPFPEPQTVRLQNQTQIRSKSCWKTPERKLQTYVWLGRVNLQQTSRLIQINQLWEQL